MSLASHRPRTIGGIVDVTFAFYRANFANLLTVALLVITPVAIIKMVAPVELQRVLEAVGNLLIPLGQGAIVAVVAGVVERDQSPDVGDAFRSTSGRAGSLIAVQIASGLMVLIGLILLVVPGLFALVWTAVCVPVVMIERVGYSAAIERSRALARGRWGHVFGTLLLSWGLAFLLIVGAGFVMGALGASGRVADFLGELLFAAVLPIPTIATAFLYYDLRVRNESADLSAMLADLPGTVPDV
jgi:hypothetical protein